jgi:hypothetical protein
MKYEDKIKKRGIFNQKSTKKIYPPHKTYFCSKHQETYILITLVMCNIGLFTIFKSKNFMSCVGFTLTLSM